MIGVFCLLMVGMMVFVSVIANALLPAASHLPMQWGLKRGVNWSAPRWIALAFTPILAIAVLAFIFFLSDSGSEDGQGVTVAVAAAFLLGHGLHLWLVWRHLTR